MMVPADFEAEAKQAFDSGDGAHLILQSLEVVGLPFEVAGKAMVDEYLARLPTGVPAERVMLFTGHRVDAPDRAAARFPASGESIARQSILDSVRREQELGSATGVAGGANGGDILFLEACSQLDIPFEMLLALPQDEFIKASVTAPSGDWEQRFRTLAAKSTPRVLADTPDLPEWLRQKKDYGFWARNNMWLISSALALTPKHFTLLALWDGKTGDGPGGTEHMVQTAEQHGAKLIHLDTRQLFAIRNAAQ